MNADTELAKYGLTPETYERCLADCAAKVEGISSDDWYDIIDRYGLSIHYDTLRKASQTIFGGAFVAEYISQKQATRSATDNAEGEAKAILAMVREEKKQLAAMKVELNRADTHNARLSLFIEQLCAAAERLSVPEMYAVPVPDQTREWVLGIGDLHYGAKFSTLRNSYSREECEARLNRLIGFVCRDIKWFGIDRITLVNVGDTIQGLLRMTDFRVNDIPVVEAVIEVSRLLAAFINELSAHVYVDYYHVKSANHAQVRPLGSKANEAMDEDFEKIIVEWIKDLLADNPRVRIMPAISRNDRFTVAGFNCAAMHGQEIRGKEDAAADISWYSGDIVDYTFFGHSHADLEKTVGERERNNAKVFVIPSLMGTDPYAERMMKGCKGEAKLYGFNPDYGFDMSRSYILTRK